MADEVKIDKDNFQSRLSHFISAWKTDKRQSNDALFGGVGSIVVLMGRNEDNPSFHKNNAMHVCMPIEASQYQRFDEPITVLAPWIRIPCYADGVHPGDALHCHYCEEGYVALEDPVKLG